jgi:hypothetical protein
MSKDIEKRYLTETVELRKDDNGGLKLGGYALKFNKLSQNLGGFVERILPGALNKTLADGGDVLARFQHEDNFLLGRTSAGTLRLSVDEVGLMYEVDLPDTSYARDLAALAARGDVRNSSFAFWVPPEGDSWSLTDQGFPLRSLAEIGLADVAPVVSPAYLDTTTGLRHLAEARNLDLDAVQAAAASNALADLLVERAEPEPVPEAPSEPHVPVGLLRLKGDWLSRRPTI